MNYEISGNKELFSFFKIVHSQLKNRVAKKLQACFRYLTAMKLSSLALLYISVVLGPELALAYAKADPYAHLNQCTGVILTDPALRSWPLF